MRTKFVKATDLGTLETRLNEELSKIPSDGIKQIVYAFSEFSAVIEYDEATINSKSICAECQHWQENEASSLMGMCQMKGKRKRFDCKACESYLDFRV